MPRWVADLKGVLVMKKDIYVIYSKESDITFIMEDICIGDDEIETHIRGFYYGNPSDENTKKYFGCL